MNTGNASEHDRIKELLALAVAGALEREEEAELERHMRECEECSGEREAWRVVTASLRAVPTPEPSAAVVERARLLASARLAAQEELRATKRMVAVAIAFAWVMGLASWPLMSLAGRAALGWMEWPAAGVWVPLAGYTVLAFVSAGVAALLLGQRARKARRSA